MQFEDPRSILEAAAASPSRELDARLLIARGTRLRRVRYALTAGATAVVVAGASVSMGAVGTGDGADVAPGPAAPSPCREVTERVRLRFGGRNEAAIESARERVRRAVREIRRLMARADRGKGAATTGDRGRAAAERSARRALAAAEEALEEVRTLHAAEVSKPVRPECAGRAGDAPSGVTAVLRRAGCSLNPPEFVEAPGLGSDKWCIFEVVFENRGDREATLGDFARLLLVDASATPTFSTAYTEGPAPPEVDDLRIGPGRTVTRRLHFAVDPRDEPTALVFGSGQDAISLSFEYDCPADLTSHPRPVCYFHPSD